LPLNRIRNVTIKTTNSLTTNNLPRVYVDWEHFQGRLNTFSLEVRTGSTREATFPLAEELRARICQAVGDADQSDPGGILWPFESSSLDFARNPARQRVTSADRWAGAGAALVAATLWIACSVAIFLSTHTNLSGVFGGIGGAVAVGVYSATVMDRVRRRGR
jgi:hypothetical protein